MNKQLKYCKKTGDTLPVDGRGYRILHNTESMFRRRDTWSKMGVNDKQLSVWEEPSSRTSRKKEAQQGRHGWG